MKIDSGAKSELVALLNQERGTRTYLGVRAEDDLPSGWETYLHGLVVTYEQHGRVRREALVLRCHDGPEAEQRAAREHKVMRRVAEMGVPVPKVRLRLPSGAPFRFPCLVMERVEGGTAHERLQGATPAEVRAQLKELLEPLARLHRLEWRRVLPEVPEVVGAEARIQALQAAAERFEFSEFRPLLEWLRQHMPGDVEPRLSICHNDYHPQNLIVRESGNDLVVLDWSFAEVGDFRLDLAWSVLLFGAMLGRRFRGDVIETYRELSGRNLDDFEFYEALKLTQRMLTLASWLDEAVDIPVGKITPGAMRGDYKVHVLNVYQRLVELTGVRLPMFEAL